MNSDGGPAFPPAMVIASGCHNTIDASAGPGLTIRDYFAAKAMQSMLVHNTYGYNPLHLARVAYAQADAMLTVRGSTP